MTERRLQHLVGLLLVLSHFGLLGYTLYLYVAKGFSLEEMTTIIAVIAPAFAGYTTSILAIFIANQHQIVDRTRRVNAAFSLLALAIPGVLVVAVGISLRLKAYNLAFDSFEDFKRFLLLVESLFGAFAGMFVYSLFKKQEPVGIPRDTDSQAR